MRHVVPCSVRLASRARAAVVAAVLASMVLGPACGGVLGSTAATVNGERIHQSSLDRTLRAIQQNKAYFRAFGETPDAVRGQGEGTFKAAFASFVLTQRIYGVLVAQELARRKLTVTPVDLQEAEERLVTQLGRIGKGEGEPADEDQGRRVLAGFPADYQADLIRREAETVVLLRELARSGTDDAEAQKFLEERKAELATVCASHILVATEAEATAIAGELAGGAAFGELAAARSTDPTAKQNEGALGCGAPGRYPAELAQATLDLPVGQVGGPVKTQFGFHLIKVTRREEPSLLKAQEAVADARFSELLQTLATEADIDVNPRYGRFDASEGQLQVVPPEAPGPPISPLVPAPPSAPSSP